MTQDQPISEAAAEKARVEKLLETAQQLAVNSARIGRDMDRIKRRNGIAAALNRRLEPR